MREYKALVGILACLIISLGLFITFSHGNPVQLQAPRGVLKVSSEPISIRVDDIENTEGSGGTFDINLILNVEYEEGSTTDMPDILNEEGSTEFVPLNLDTHDAPNTLVEEKDIKIVSESTFEGSGELENVDTSASLGTTTTEMVMETVMDVKEEHLTTLPTSFFEEHTTLAPLNTDDEPWLGIIDHLTTESTTLEEHSTTYVPIISNPNDDDIQNYPTTKKPIQTIETPESLSTTVEPPIFHVRYYEHPETKIHEVKYYYADDSETKYKPAPKAGSKAKKIKKSKKRNKNVQTTIDPFSDFVTSTSDLKMEENVLEMVDFRFNVTDVDLVVIEGPVTIV